MLKVITLVAANLRGGMQKLGERRGSALFHRNGESSD